MTRTRATGSSPLRGSSPITRVSKPAASQSTYRIRWPSTSIIGWPRATVVAAPDEGALRRSLSDTATKDALRASQPPTRGLFVEAVVPPFRLCGCVASQPPTRGLFVAAARAAGSRQRNASSQPPTRGLFVEVGDASVVRRADTVAAPDEGALRRSHKQLAAAISAAWSQPPTRGLFVEASRPPARRSYRLSASQPPTRGLFVEAGNGGLSTPTPRHVAAPDEGALRRSDS